MNKQIDNNKDRRNLKLFRDHKKKEATSTLIWLLKIPSLDLCQQNLPIIWRVSSFILNNFQWVHLKGIEMQKEVIQVSTDLVLTYLDKTRQNSSRQKEITWAILELRSTELRYLRLAATWLQTNKDRQHKRISRLILWTIQICEYLVNCLDQIMLQSLLYAVRNQRSRLKLYQHLKNWFLLRMIL